METDLVRHAINGCRNSSNIDKGVVYISKEIEEIEYLTYKRFKLKEKEYKEKSKLKVVESLLITDIEKILIESCLSMYEEEINIIKRKIEFEIIKETLF